MGRYDGKPFLRLLDCYILKAIGHLDRQHEEWLRTNEARFGKVYGTTASWDRIVADQMQFSESFPTEVRRTWDNYVQWAHQNKVAIDPEQFVVEFMERYFPDIVA